MAPFPNTSGSAAVVQGYFAGGRPRLPVPARPGVAQARAEQVRHGNTASALAGQRHWQKAAVAPGPVVQRVGNGEAFQLPANLSSFGGGGGQPLPEPVRQKMESYFGTSFADVRIHVGAQVASIGALAFTQGSNLYFAPGQYNPTTGQGQQLLGHELTHVVQQRAGRVRNPFASGIAVVQDRAMEAEADRNGLRVAAHPMPVQAKAAAGGLPKKAAAGHAPGAPERVPQHANRHSTRPAHPAGRPDAATVQRLNAIQRFISATENRRYLIDSTQTHLLFSERSAPPPVPRGLYERGNASYKNVPLYSWLPNVRFISSQEKTAIPTETPGRYKYSKTGSGPQMDVLDIRELQKEVRNPRDKSVMIGALGKNDCNIWASTLQNLIASDWEARRLALQSPRKNQTVYLNQDGAIPIGVGDLMKHIYKDSKSCNYHAATVVAKDGSSLVTLEGHVSKNLTRPEFHIREGIVGFADEGIRAGLGDKVEVSTVAGLSARGISEERSTRERRFQQFGGPDLEKYWEYESHTFSLRGRLIGDIGITATTHREQQLALERERWARRIETMRLMWQNRIGGDSINSNNEGNTYIHNDML